ncbi:MAG: sugar-binding domain-containing protein [Melioribacteraceae bacterium]
MSKFHKFLFIALFFLNLLTFAQIQIEELSSDFESNQDSLFLGTTLSRSVQSLNGEWKAFREDDQENFINVTFPIKTTSNKTFIFENEFSIDAKKINLNFIKLHFLGLNYSAEIFINNASIYKHPGSCIPFTLDLSPDLLNYDSPNVLRVKLAYLSDSKNTIPLAQQFLFPKNFGGVFRDVFLSFKPKVGIKNTSIVYEKDSKPYKAKLSFKVELENFKELVADSVLKNFNGRFKLDATLKIIGDTSYTYHNTWNIRPLRTKDFQKEFYTRLRSIKFWSNLKPLTYLLTVKLTNGDGYVYDEYKKKLSLFDFKKKNGKLFLNENEFKINGVTYIRSNENSIANYAQIKKDITKIKELGFNTVRFSKVVPHPYAVYLCEELGLFAFTEIPLNSVPERFTENGDFQTRATSFISRFMKFFNQYPAVIAYGAGGSYLSSSQSHLNFINIISETIKNETPNKLSYSSFIGKPTNKTPNIDLYGVELFSNYSGSTGGKFPSHTESDSLLYFISEATYPTFKGDTDGYLNNYSFEGQAKFFEGIIDYSDKNNISGFVLNTMYDFTGDFAPFYSGFDKTNLYKIGILPTDSSSSRISANLIKSKLLGGSRVSVPIGSKKDDSRFFFILLALAISAIIALLINSKRKFREDASRALIRPYNFFADIRDHRILSGFHSNILMILLASSNALLITILLYFLKSNILLEKVVLAFGSPKLSTVVNFLAWNPIKAFGYLFATSVILFILVSFIVHLFSFFVRNRILYSSIYYTAIWAFLPFALLLPIEAALYKILLTHDFNFIIYILLGLFLIWNIQRFIKGIYVIFDVRPIFVYLFSIIFFAIFSLGVISYMQYSSVALDYIALAIKQYLTI